MVIHIQIKENDSAIVLLTVQKMQTCNSVSSWYILYIIKYTETKIIQYKFLEDLLNVSFNISLIKG